MDKLILNCINFIQFILFSSPITYGILVLNCIIIIIIIKERVNPRVSPVHLLNLIIFVEIKLKHPITESCGVILMILDTNLDKLNIRSYVIFNY